MKEQSDNLECEWKFVPPESPEVVLAHFRECLPRGWRLVKWPARSKLDIYFDTESGTLYGDGATFRFRKRQRNKGWTANFKEPPLDGLPYHARREIITRITVEEALEHESGLVPGLAPTTAREYVERVSSPRPAPPLVPQLHVVSQRDGYTMRPGAIEDKESNVVSVFLDDVTVVDVRDAAIRPLITSGFLDYTKPMRSFRLRNGEIEADGTAIGDQERAVAMLQELSARLQADGVEDQPANKYQLGVRALGLWHDGST